MGASHSILNTALYLVRQRSRATVREVERSLAGAAAHLLREISKGGEPALIARRGSHRNVVSPARLRVCSSSGRGGVSKIHDVVSENSEAGIRVVAGTTNGNPVANVPIRADGQTPVCKCVV